MPEARPAPRIGPDFYAADAVTLAKRLLGQRLVRIMNDTSRLSGIIVETEAYLGHHDRAAHTYNSRRTPRNESMWHAGGTAYIYFTYGMHHCMNVVAGHEGNPVAVLIRALEPDEGLEHMRAHRTRRSGKADVPTHHLCSGPARLCQALAIDRSLDREDLTTSTRLFIERLRPRALAGRYIKNTPRIGIAYAGEWAGRPLRWCIRDNPNVSRSRPEETPSP